MKSIRLAIFFDQKISAGGGYQQALNAALLAKKLQNSYVEVQFFTSFSENIEVLNSFEIKATLINLSFYKKLLLYIRQRVGSEKLFKLVKFFGEINPFEKILVNAGVDIVYFLSPSPLAKNLDSINYITTVWDLSHRDDPEFPEVRHNREFELRDQNYMRILPKAVAILVDSEFGRDKVAKYYGIDLKRIYVMPFQPASAIRSLDLNNSTPVNINDKYQLEQSYVFYPAQFWPHKNHVYILEGLKILEERFSLHVGAIFTGNDYGNLAYIKNYAETLGLSARIRFPGFVSNEEMIELYRQSIGLVMPTYFGPTNLPPIEAFELGVPVLYSNRPELKKQVDDAALLIDLKDPGSMANHLVNLIGDKNLRDKLVKKGREKLVEVSEEDRIQILATILDDFRWKRLCWK